MTAKQSWPVIFLLGAGASVPLGMPTTDDLRRRLCNRSKAGRLATEIHKSAAYRFRMSAEDVNLETFLEHLYEIRLLIWLARRCNLPRLLPNITALSQLTSTADKEIDDIEGRVFSLVRETCADCSAPAADKLWRRVLGSVSARQLRIPIFTLNYDWTFERMAIQFPKRYELVDGFELLGGSWDSRRFDAKPVTGKINLSLFKLHGSTNWVGDGPVKSLAKFSRRGSSGNNDGPGFVMIPPGHAHEISLGDEYWRQPLHGEPPPWLGSDPFKTLQAAFESAARQARLIVVIGYAFHDETVNRAIEAALTGNAKTKVLVVDPGTRYNQAPFEWMKLSTYEIPWSRFHWLQERFERNTVDDVANAILRLT